MSINYAQDDAARGRRLISDLFRKEKIDGDKWTQGLFGNMQGSELEDVEVLERWMRVIFGDDVWECRRVVLTAIAGATRGRSYL